MTHLVAATALTLCPAPADHLLAGADLAAPVGSPPLTERSPRMRLAVLTQMRHLDALDHDAGDLRWFGDGLDWTTELNLARGLVAQVRTCPTLEQGAWVPPRAYFAAESAAHYATADAYRRRAEEYRGRIDWEPDREEGLSAWSRHFDGVATAHSDAATRYAGWAGTSWSRPRRVVLMEVRDHLGAAAWAAGVWPE